MKVLSLSFASSERPPKKDNGEVSKLRQNGTALRAVRKNMSNEMGTFAKNMPKTSLKVRESSLSIDQLKTLRKRC